jgi:predicted kinase
MVIIVFGLPGSGKSYFSKRLANELNAAYLSSDILRKKLLQNRTYSSEEKNKVYDFLLNEMIKLLREGKSVVADATFYKEEIRKKFERKINLLNEKIIFIEITADEELVKERLLKPRKDSDADFNIFLKVRKEFEPLQKEHLILKSGKDNIEAMLKDALHYIRNYHEQKGN